ncbi:MAG: ABC transporter permease [Chloroflexota bacterium]
MGVFLEGAFGSIDAFTSATLVRSTPLLFGGLAVAIAFRAGIWNIGGEGQLLAGAVGAAAIGSAAGETLPSYVIVPLEMIAGGVMGAIWAYGAAWLRQQFNVLEVISTIMLNFIAIYGVAYLVRGPLQEPQHLFPQTAVLSLSARIPHLWSGTRLHWGFIVAVFVAVALWWGFAHTARGFRIRAIGANVNAARTAGEINVERTGMKVFICSGMLAGIAGATEVTGVTYALFENISGGYGFTAIAVALLARLHPLGVIVTAIVFGALEVGGNALQRDAGIPSTIVSIVEGLLILGVLGAELIPRSFSRNASAQPPSM